SMAPSKRMPGSSPIVPRVCLPAKSGNRKHQGRAPAAVIRTSSPLKATSLNSNRPAAGGFADRSNASVRRTFKGNLEIAHRRQSYERHGACWGLTGGTNCATARDHGRKRAKVIHAITLVFLRRKHSLVFAHIYRQVIQCLIVHRRDRRHP